MKKVIESDKEDGRAAPIKMWLDDVEPSTMQQAMNLARLPFVFKWVALMPDCHQGYGMPIGGVLATRGAVICNCVGSDIGCGMHAVKTNIPVDRLMGHRDELVKIANNIRGHIPVGQLHRTVPLPEGSLPEVDTLDGDSIIINEFEPARYQLGTLGGGNHFIEVQAGSDGFIWYMIHSGSRNVGKKVADHHNKIATELNARWFSQVKPEWQLAFLPQGTDEFHDYINDMNWCVSFARKNRATMAYFISMAISEVCGRLEWESHDVAHNYVVWENHFGTNVLVHRKGATRAYENEIGIIPGSQGTASYIVRGLGNPESFKSCSHGAGRKMSRTEARKTLTVENETRALDAAGIVHAIREVDDLDEAPGAYKSISELMSLQADLVKIEVELKPLAVVKG